MSAPVSTWAACLSSEPASGSRAPAAWATRSASTATNRTVGTLRAAARATSSGPGRSGSPGAFARKSAVSALHAPDTGAILPYRGRPFTRRVNAQPRELRPARPTRDRPLRRDPGERVGKWSLCDPKLTGTRLVSAFQPYGLSIRHGSPRGRSASRPTQPQLAGAAERLSPDLEAVIPGPRRARRAGSEVAGANAIAAARQAGQRMAVAPAVADGDAGAPDALPGLAAPALHVDPDVAAHRAAHNAVHAHAGYAGARGDGPLRAVGGWAHGRRLRGRRDDGGGGGRAVAQQHRARARCERHGRAGDTVEIAVAGAHEHRPRRGAGLVDERDAAQEVAPPHAAGAVALAERGAEVRVEALPERVRAARAVVGDRVVAGVEQQVV